MPVSMVSAYFDSPAYKRSLEAEERRDEATVAIVTRLDNVVRAVSNLQKQVAGMPR